jgi:hypothetical protein
MCLKEVEMLAKLMLELINDGFFISFRSRNVVDIELHLVKEGMGVYATLRKVYFDKESVVCDCINEMKLKINTNIKIRRK